MKLARRVGAILASFLLALSPAGIAKDGDSGDALFADFSAFVRKTMTETAVPGAAVGVLYGGESYTAGFGVTNVEHPLGVNAQTLFQVGSITKTMTGTILMQLVDRGELDLDAPLRRYVPQFKVADSTATDTATVRHLLSHMGGWVGDYFSSTGEGSDALDRMMVEMAELGQLAPIGTVYSYNNSGYYVASKVVESITGEPYEDTFRSVMVDQIGLENTFIEPADIMTRRFAVGHTVSASGTHTAEPYKLPRVVYGAGGAIMPVGDMLKYAAFHMGNGENVEGERVLTKKSLREMQAVQAPKHGSDESIGLTWHIDQVGPVRTVSHGGATVGQIAYLTLVPEHEFAVAVVTNANTGRRATPRIVAQALQQFLGARAEKPASLALAQEQLRAYVGTYSRPFADVVVTLEDGQLQLQQIIKQGFPDNDSPPPEPAPPLPVEFFDEDQVRSLTDSRRAAFVRGPDGEIGWVRWGRRIHVRQP